MLVDLNLDISAVIIYIKGRLILALKRIICIFSGEIAISLYKERLEGYLLTIGYT